MASEKNLNAVFTDIANAIRGKKGTTDQIKPINMADEIANLPSGGGGDIDALIDRSITEIKSNATSVGIYAFYNATKLVSANFPNAISIGQSSFNGCDALSSISFPKVTSLGSSAFSNCKSIVSADFPNVTSIDGYIFNSCEKLVSVNLPKIKSLSGACNFYRNLLLESINLPLVTSGIPYQSFYSCEKLSSVNIPNATSIGTEAFYNCKSIVSADFPNVTSIGTRAFQNCSSLSSINFPAATTIENYAFGNDQKLREIKLPMVTKINTAAFQNSSITLVDFSVVTLIANQAFEYCRSLSCIIIRTTNSVCSLNNVNCFNNSLIKTSETEGFIYVPDDLVESYKTATNWAAYASKIKPLSELEA